MCRLLILAVVAAVVAVLGVPEATAQQAVACPEPKTQGNFDAKRYLGLWHEMKRVPRDFEDDGECGTAHYSMVNESDISAGINVLNSNFVPNDMTVGTVNLLATPDDIDNGKLSVTFPTQPQIPASKYWVLKTDYDTYAVVYSCQNLASAVVPHVTLWVLARNTSTYTATVDATVTETIKSAGLDPSILKPVQHQAGCPSTTCSPCSSAQQSLDVAKLKGRWWEVQHSPYSTGYDKQSCSLAQVTATSEGIAFNATTYEMSSETDGADRSMVLDAKWSDANKKDGVFDIDGSGKFCVLGTDYDSWAVVSVCIPPTSVTTATPIGPVASSVPAAAGGVFVLARRRGLSADQQMKANKVVINAGIPAASMQATPSTPCPEAALAGTTSGAASAVVTPAILILSALAAVLVHFRPAQ